MVTWPHRGVTRAGAVCERVEVALRLRPLSRQRRAGPGRDACGEAPAGRSSRAPAGAAIVRALSILRTSAETFALALVLVLTAACSGLVSRGEPAQVREPAPAFTLESHLGSGPSSDGPRTVSLSDLLARGPALVVFYRGHW